MQVSVRNLQRKLLHHSYGRRGVSEPEHDAAAAQAIHCDGHGLESRRGTWGDGNFSKPMRRERSCWRLTIASAGNQTRADFIDPKNLHIERARRGVSVRWQRRGI